MYVDKTASRRGLEMITIAQIGCGYWGPNLVRNFNQIKDCKLHTVCDPREDRLEYVKSNYPYVKTTKNYKELLHDSEIDAIIVATEAETHYKLAREGLSEGKHIFVEKPLSMFTRECKDLIELSESKNLTLMVGHTFEYNAAVQKIKKYIMNGELGDLYYIYSQRLNLGRVRHDINAMWNLAPHDVSIILFWLEEEPVKVSAHGVAHLQKGIEDVVFINLDFGNGKFAHIHSSWLDPNKVRKMTIVASKKMVVYDDVSSDAKVQIYDKGIDKKNLGTEMGPYDDFGKFQLLQRAGDILIPKINFVEPLKVECAHFIQCIREHKRPLTDGRNGLRVVKILEAAQESLKNGGKTVKITG